MSMIPFLHSIIICSLISFAVAASDYFEVQTGDDCSVNSLCFFSPNFPSDYSKNQYCNISVMNSGTLSVQSFSVESYLYVDDDYFDDYFDDDYTDDFYDYDFLFVGEIDYYGNNGPEDVIVRKGDNIIFYSNNEFQDSGFKICIVPEPTTAPTFQPTPSPTPVCDRGTYLSEARTCEPCEVGRFSNVSGVPYAHNCTLCPAGFSQANTGSISCDACTSGLSSEDRASCRECVPGEYARDSVECVECESGRYAPVAQVDSCLVCFAGDATNNETGATACSSCAAGTYSGDFATSCIDCPEGTKSQVRSSECTDCPAGTYSSAEASISCTNCEAGKVAPNSSATNCEECTAGRSQSLTGQLACTDCVAGTASAYKGLTSCTECRTGTFAWKSGLTNCSNCDLGYYQANTASSSCVKCSSGTFTDKTASVDCDDCDLGYDSPPGSSSCNVAAGGYYIDTDGDGLAHECPTGANCEGGWLLPKPKQGRWVNRKNLRFATIIEKCTRNTCKGGSGNNSCWLPSSFSFSNKTDNIDDEDECESDELLCVEGSFGPLCGACKDFYTLSATLARCVPCTSDTNRAPLLVTLCIAVIGIGSLATIAYLGFGQSGGFNGGSQRALQLSPVKFFFKLPLIRLLKHVDMGMARVAWSTYQIISSISWNLNVSYPQPFRSALGVLSFLQLDFLSLDCVSGESSFYARVYTMSLAPMIVVLMNGVVCMLRIWCAPLRHDHQPNMATIIKSQHAYVFLLVTYLVLPPISMIHFQSLDCLTLGDGHSYLRSDTSIRCDDSDYSTFSAIVALFLLIYQSIPLLWLFLLRIHLEQIDPLGDRDPGNDPNATLQVSLEARALDPSIAYLSFLWDGYLPNMWYFEVIDMYRRILFIGVLPLLGTGSLRATAGCCFSILLAAYFREASPYIRTTTNMLAVVAQYQILANFFGALIILSSSLAVFGFSDFGLGCFLIGANLIILILCGLWCHRRYLRAQEIAKWRKALTTQQHDIIFNIMAQNIRGRSENRMNRTPSIEDQDVKAGILLEQYILHHSDVTMDKKIGAGAFGEVFKGTCQGVPVAIKTMIDVTEENARDFRAEILMTATLRHPNIVNFVGACWGRELTCLVLEWVPRGSFQSLLSDVTQNLTWSEPLLRLTTDIARGMDYLHKREYYDEREERHCSCIVHRDLKPENVLVTEYMNGKITDFGTSRPLSDDDFNLSAVGTPVFCAPEVMKGEKYDEKIDIYAFGMSLIIICLEQSFVEFIGERYCIAFNKKKAPKQPMRLIRPMVEDAWRPITRDNPIEFAPPTIVDLIIRCCDHNIQNRPSFENILELLENEIAIEIQIQDYYRYPANSRPKPGRKMKSDVDLLKKTSLKSEETDNNNLLNKKTDAEEKSVFSNTATTKQTVEEIDRSEIEINEIEITSFSPVRTPPPVESSVTSSSKVKGSTI